MNYQLNNTIDNCHGGALVLTVLLTMDAVEIRNRMRSVDDLMYYGRWKRESLQMHSARRHNDEKVDRGYRAGNNVSLNQSYSCESTLTATAATDDEARPGHTQRKRRTLRVRRRAASIVSAPTARRINLDDSIGSAALDVDSMFRFFATSASTPAAADDGIGRPPLKPEGLPPSGRPPSGAAGTSARRSSHRRRRRPSSSVTDLTNGSVNTVSFDEVQRTSSTVDLKDAMAVVVVASTTESENSSVEQRKPVRSLRRRRRTSESPSPTSTQDSTEAAASATLTSVASDSVTAVSNREVLWDLCGEKLDELCRRILDSGVANTDDVVTELTSPDNIAESGRSEVEAIQPTDVVEDLPPVSQQRRTKGVFYSADLTAYRLSPVHHVVPDLSQPASQSSNATDETKDNYTCVENDVTGTDADADGDVTVHLDNDDLDDDSGHRSRSITATEDDVYRQGSEETAVNHILPSDGDHDVEQTETHSLEHCHGGIEPAEATMSDQSRTVGTPPTGKNHDSASSTIEERRCSPALDINAMLSPSIGLQDILDTIYTLTGGVIVEERTTDKDGSASLSPRALPPENPAENGRVTTGDDCRQLPDNIDDIQSAAVGLDRADDDDDDENSLDLDSEMYDYDLPPAATELADSLHLAIAEDDDDLDLDIADYEYDLDDGDVL